MWAASIDLGSAGVEGLNIPADAVRFVDGVRCGDPNDPHPVIDFDSSSRIETVLGRPARVAGGAWQVFGYRLTVQNPSQPHLLVITYPDDTYRRVHFRVMCKGGYGQLRASINTVYSAFYKLSTNAWAKFSTPLFIPGAKTSEITILFGDSRRSRSLAPNHQGPTELAPWAVGEVLLYEIVQPEKVLPPLKIAYPVPPDQERYFGFDSLGYAEPYLQDPANKDFMKRYLAHLGVNFLRFAGGQGGPPFGQPAFENQLALLDEMGLRTSFALFKYFNAFLRDRLKTKTLPQELIDTMPKPIKEAIDNLDGWNHPDNLYEGGSYQARLMVMPLNWLDPAMGPWLAKMLHYYLEPAAKHPCVFMVQFFGTGARVGAEGRHSGAEVLAEAIQRFTDTAKAVRPDLVVEVPSLYMDLRARERNNHPLPYTFDWRNPYADIGAQGTPTVDRVGLYDGWPEEMKGVIGGVGCSLWRGFHMPPLHLAILDSPEVRQSLQRFMDGWIADCRICEQNESESPKGIGWINDYYPWAGDTYRINVLKMMAANPRYLLLNMGWEFSAGQEANLRTLAAAWRAFPWGKTEDLSATVAPRGKHITALRCQDRILLLNHDPIRQTIELPPGTCMDAVTGEAIPGGILVLEPFGIRTILIGKL